MCPYIVLLCYENVHSLIYSISTLMSRTDPRKHRVSIYIYVYWFVPFFFFRIYVSLEDSKTDWFIFIFNYYMGTTPKPIKSFNYVDLMYLLDTTACRLLWFSLMRYIIQSTFCWLVAKWVFSKTFTDLWSTPKAYEPNNSTITDVESFYVDGFTLKTAFN